MAIVKLPEKLSKPCKAILTFFYPLPFPALFPSLCWCHRDSRLLTFSLPFLLFRVCSLQFKVHSFFGLQLRALTKNHHHC